MYWAAIAVFLLLAAASVQEQGFELRLSNIGGKQGRVEVLNNGTWGTICRDGWDFYDALVVCKQLGYPWLMGYGWKQYENAGNGTGPAWLSNVQCKGSETRLDQCANDGWREHLCNDTGRAAGVVCVDQDRWTAYPVFSYEISLGNGGLGNNEGLVMLHLYTGDVFHVFLLCDQGWDLADADVVCRQRRLTSARLAPTNSYFGRHNPSYFFDGPVSYLATEFACTGNESNILQCPAQTWFQDDCPAGHAAGVVCNRIEDSEAFQLRLEGGSTPNEGRVEIFTNGTWGSICVESDFSFAYDESNVICRQLGLGYGLETPWDDRFGRSSGPVAKSGYIACSGGESSFAQCYFPDNPDQECFSKENSYQASVICSGLFPESRSPVRLTGVKFKEHGLVLIQHDGRWGTICNKGWTMANTEVVCRELGFGPPEQALESGWPGSGPIFLSGVSCRGDEATLDECELGEWSQHECSHAMDVRITCGLGLMMRASLGVLLTSMVAIFSFV